MNTNKGSNETIQRQPVKPAGTVDYRPRILELLSRITPTRLKLVKYRRKTPEEAEAFFWSHVEIREPNECWLWTGATTPVGNLNGDVYGLASINGRAERSHRFAYEFCKGPIPAGLVVCHDCDVYLCGNPAHLTADTSRKNIEAAVERGLIPRGPTAPSHVTRRLCHEGKTAVWQDLIRSTFR
jgi:hypothetical protein